MANKKKCIAEVESRPGPGVSWGDIRPCGRNAVANSEYCAAHNPDKAVERAQRAYAKRHGLEYKPSNLNNQPSKIVAHTTRDCCAYAASQLGKHGFLDAAKFLYALANSKAEGR